MLTELVSLPSFKVNSKAVVLISMHNMNILPMPRINRRFLACSDSKFIKDFELLRHPWTFIWWGESCPSVIFRKSWVKISARRQATLDEIFHSFSQCVQAKRRDSALNYATTVSLQNLSNPIPSLGDFKVLRASSHKSWMNEWTNK